MINLGLDLHIRNSFVTGPKVGRRRLVNGRCGNTLAEVAQLLAPVEKLAKARGEAVRVVLESTGNARPMVRLLEQYGREAGIDLTADVLDAWRLRVIAESTCKCDRVDAAVLQALADSNLKLPTCYVPDDEVFSLREYLRARSDLVATATMLKNRIHAVLHRRGILRPAKLDLFTKAGRRYLDALSLDEAGRSILTRYLAALDELARTIESSMGSLRDEARRDRWRRPCALLMSMPGVGLITALVILSELGELSRFKSRSAVSNYAGLVPRVRDSNETQRRGHITKRGSRHLRHVLIEAAWTASGKSPRYANLFARVAARGGKLVAVVAVARRMLEDAFTILKRNEPFREAGDPQPHERSDQRSGKTSSETSDETPGEKSDEMSDEMSEPFREGSPSSGEPTRADDDGPPRDGPQTPSHRAPQAVAPLA